MTAGGHWLDPAQGFLYGAASWRRDLVNENAR